MKTTLPEGTTVGQAFAITDDNVYDTSGIEYPVDEVYRCPVSTPTVGRRPGYYKMQNPIQPFIAFTSMNHSLQIPRDISAPKHSEYKMSKSRRVVAKPQKKNFDCYFVNRGDKSVTSDNQVKSTWLNTLCAQPVDEIFGKYKRRSEASRRHVQTRVRNSTPGEKALVSGWSSNASNRGSPSRSKSHRSMQTSQSRNSRLSSIDPSFRVYEPDPERGNGNHGFALLPVGSPTQNDCDETLSPRSSPLFQKVFKHSGSYNIVAPYNGVMSSTASVDSSIYEPYQRDKRFPEIRPRKSSVSPTRKIVHSDVREFREERPTSETVTTSSMTQELQESPIHIVSIGKLDNVDKMESETITRITLSGKCAYRLPKQHALSMSLLELQSNS